MAARPLRILVLSSVATAAVIWLNACWAMPPLTSNLPTDIAEAAREFDRRVQARFPAGSLETDVVRELSSQGFVRSADRGDSSSSHVYSFEKGNFPCNFVWNIVWKTDGAGLVTMVNGIYFASCP
jgi:hypothetical protein